MSVFTLAIFCLTTFNLPCFMDLTFPVPMQYCFFSIGLYTSITSHIHNWLLFLLWLHLFILSGIIFPLFSSSILGTYWLGEFIFQCLSFCLFLLFIGFSRQEYRLPFPSPVDHILLEFSTMAHPLWSWSAKKIKTQVSHFFLSSPPKGWDRVCKTLQLYLISQNV